MVLLLRSLPEGLLPAAVELDRQVFGGFWSLDAYRTELNRTSSTLAGIWHATTTQDPALLALGCSWVIEDEAHIILMAVDPVHRQRCLGTALLL
ncbi:MAG TPA: ribosomal-protein-alanine N-acetyltransferase RimI, partial [Stenomitos sp.]